MTTITKKQFNMLTGRYVFKSQFMNKLAELPRNKGVLVDVPTKSSYKYQYGMYRVAKITNYQFVIKKTLDKKQYAVLRIK